MPMNMLVILENISEFFGQNRSEHPWDFLRTNGSFSRGFGHEVNFSNWVSSLHYLFQDHGKAPFEQEYVLFLATIKLANLNKSGFIYIVNFLYLLLLNFSKIVSESACCSFVAPR